MTTFRFVKDVANGMDAWRGAEWRPIHQPWHEHAGGVQDGRGGKGATFRLPNPGVYRTW